MKYLFLLSLLGCFGGLDDPWIKECMTDVNEDGNLWSREECEEESKALKDFKAQCARGEVLCR